MQRAWRTLGVSHRVGPDNRTLKREGYGVANKSLNNFAARLGIIGELLGFLWQRRLWWLIPMVVVIVVFGVLLIFAQGSAVAPFIYTLF